MNRMALALFASGIVLLTVGAIAPPLSGLGTPCPGSISGVLASDRLTPVTATLVSAQTAESLEGVYSYFGLIAVYQIQGGYTVGQVLIPSFGGQVSQTFGQLQGYHYNGDASCTSYSVVTSTSTTSASQTSTVSTTTGTSGPPPNFAVSPLLIAGIVLLAVGGFVALRKRR